MAAQPAPSPVFQAFGSNGAPLAFGQLFTYAAGTTTAQATWTDATQATQNPNPVVLNAFGQANVWTDPTKTYKFILQDALGNQLYAVDNLPGSAGLAFSSTNADKFTTTLNQTAFILTAAPASINNLIVVLDGSTLAPGDDFSLAGSTLTLVRPTFAGQRLVAFYGQAVAQTVPSAGSVTDASLSTSSRIFAIDQTYIPGAPSNANFIEGLAGVTPTNPGYPLGDVRRYGYTLGNLSFDNGPALQAAVNVANITGNTIDLPADAAAFSTFPSLSGLRNIVFRGRGACNTGLFRGTTLVFTGSGSGTIVNARGSDGCGFKALQFFHNNAGFTGTYFDFGNNSFLGFFEDCVIGQTIGSGHVLFSLDQAEEFKVDRCLFLSGNPSVVGAASGSFSNIVRFTSCTWPDNIPGTPVTKGGEAWTFINCSFGKQATGGAGLAFDSVGATTPFKGLSFYGCWFGDATSSSTWINAIGLGLTVSGCRFGSQGGTAIQLNGVSGFEITGCNFDTFTNAISFPSASNTGGVITGNNFVNCTNVFGNTANIPPSMIFNPNNVAGALVAPITSVNGNFAANGYEVSPNGNIRMWGSKSVTAGTPLAITFATEVGRAFPTAVFRTRSWFEGTPGASATGTYTSSPSTTGVTLNVAGGTAASTVGWEATGN